MQLRVSTLPAEDPSLQPVLSLANDRQVRVNVADANLDCTTGDGRRVLLFGDVFYWLNDHDSIRQVTTADGEYLAGLFGNLPPTEIVPRLEGQYVGLIVDPAGQTVTFFTDRYARRDIFYAQDGGHLFLTSDLDFIFEHVRPEYDQVMLAHLFCVYGWYTPKGHTIYANVRQLRVGEVLTLGPRGLGSDILPFEPQEIEDYTDDHLETYYRYFRESVLARVAGANTVWVSSSSGWDSSIILGMLVEELGADKVRMITGSMKYSRNTETINKFEIDKVKHIGEYYGVDPVIVLWDMESKRAGSYWESILPYYKSRHIYCFPSFNFARMADELSLVAGTDSPVFNGEASDSFHNFGFSQFCTFFHTAKSFTEYADKMNCYLYGPSFFKKALDGSYEKDKVYQIFRHMNPGVEYDAGDGSREGTIERYLFPFFYGSPRLPFARTEANPALSAGGRQAVFSFPYRTYMPEVLTGMTESNLYSWYVYLYMSFHTQGSTASIHKHSVERTGHPWRSPFIDCRLMDLLARAPERWGRGLELNNTKYPQKWVARNKIRFPYKLLDEGPHSYLYDVIEGFSLYEEMVYRSGAADFLKQKLADKPYRSLLSDEYFDVRYLDGLVDDYLAGREAKGKDFANLVSLLTLVITGWY